VHRALLALALLALTPAAHAWPSGHEVQGVAPFFSLTTLEGADVSLDGLHGSVVVLHRMAVGCAACRESEDVLRGVRDDAAGDLVLLSVDAWADPALAPSEPEDREELAALVAERGLDWPHALDTDGVAARYGAGVPAVDVLGRGGHFVARFAGMPDAEALAEAVGRALAAPPVPHGVVAYGHEPAVVEAGTQFTAFLRMEPGAFGDVRVQVCIVSELVCIISPRPATLADDGVTWRYNTSEFRAPGGSAPYRWDGGDRIGAQWFLAEDGEGGMQPFPDGIDMASPGCDGREAAVRCYETHYVAFDIPAGGRATPAVGWLALALVLLVVARARR